MCKISQVRYLRSCPSRISNFAVGREIPADVAARTDEQNEFPAEMWKKMGDAGYGFSQVVNSLLQEGSVLYSAY